MSQRRFSPYGLFSRAEDKVKLSDDVIERLLDSRRKSVEVYFTLPAVLLTCQSPAPFQKRSQLFIGVRNETLSVVAMRVNNPGC